MAAVTLVIVLAPSFSGHDSYFAAPFIAIVFGLAIRYLLEVLTGICQAVAAVRTSRWTSRHARA